jgi:hypothetical protein
MPVEAVKRKQQLQEMRKALRVLRRQVFLSRCCSAVFDEVINDLSLVCEEYLTKIVVPC